MSNERRKMILDSIDKALEYLIIIFSILIAILFQFLCWIAKPPDPLNPNAPNDLPIITGFMVSLTLPLVITMIAWFLKKTYLFSINEEKRMYLRLFSWGISQTLFIYYCILFLIGWTLGSIEKILGYLNIWVWFILLITSIVSGIIPINRIINIYKGVTTELRIWEKGKYLITFLIGILCSTFIILFFLLYEI